MSKRLVIFITILSPILSQPPNSCLDSTSLQEFGFEPSSPSLISNHLCSYAWKNGTCVNVPQFDSFISTQIANLNYNRFILFNLTTSLYQTAINYLSTLPTITPSTVQLLNPTDDSNTTTTPQQLNTSTAQQLNSATPQQLNSSTAQHLSTATAQQLMPTNPDAFFYIYNRSFELCYSDLNKNLIEVYCYASSQRRVKGITGKTFEVKHSYPYLRNCFPLFRMACIFGAVLQGLNADPSLLEKTFFRNNDSLCGTQLLYCQENYSSRQCTDSYKSQIIENFIDSAGIVGEVVFSQLIDSYIGNNKYLPGDYRDVKRILLVNNDNGPPLEFIDRNKKDYLYTSAHIPNVLLMIILALMLF